jgi:hypothetical protein
MLYTTFIISYFDPVQITITISYVLNIIYHINVYRILLLVSASSVAIALALRKNRSLGKTFWFTDDHRPVEHLPNSHQTPGNYAPVFHQS